MVYYCAALLPAFVVSFLFARRFEAGRLLHECVQVLPVESRVESSTLLLEFYYSTTIVRYYNSLVIVYYILLKETRFYIT
jgi:hypothetical protein